MRYRIIALDLDGTLLTPEKTILPASLAALKDARQAGAKVILVTGRHHCAIHPYYQALNLDEPAICCNGTYLYDYKNKTVITGNPLQHQQALDVIKLLQKTPIHTMVYADDVMIWEKMTGYIERAFRWAATLPVAQRPVWLQVPSLTDAVSQANTIWKFALNHTDTEQLQQVARHIEQQLGLTCEWSWQDQVDITSPGNSKGRRLAQWVNSEGFSMNDVLAFGDNYNDLSMLEAAGMGVAMGNADAAIKTRADKVTSTNDQPGIAEIIRSQWC